MVLTRGSPCEWSAGPSTLSGSLVLCGLSVATAEVTGPRAQNGHQTSCTCPGSGSLQIRACRSGCHNNEATKTEVLQANSLHSCCKPRGNAWLSVNCLAAHKKDPGRSWSPWLPVPGIPAVGTFTLDCGCDWSEFKSVCTVGMSSVVNACSCPLRSVLHGALGFH